MVTTKIESRTAPEAGSARLNQPATRTGTGSDSGTQATGDTFRNLLDNEASNRLISTAETTGSTPAPAATSTSDSPVAGLAALMGSNTAPAKSVAPEATASTSTTPSTPWTPANSTGPHDIPTAEELFGANPWIQNPTGSAPDGATWSYNPRYFATPETAAKVASMVGGTVVQENEFCPTGPLVQNQTNAMVKLANGKEINAGEFASFFTHGYPQYYVDHLINQELEGQVG